MTELRDQLQKTLGDQYTLEQELGGGGMSRVFVAKESSLGRQVVVKVLPPEMAASVSIDRFRREIQLAAQLQHPHIVPLLNAGETEGLPYFTMPFVKGESLRAKLARGGELPLSEAIRILREVASALSYAHENKVVHRDIKPENILISGGSAMVTDFGVAKAVRASSGASGQNLTSLGVALGTPAYMAPEQATADPNTDHRADIYALGVVAYEMLTGSTPFSGRSPQAMLAAQVTENPDPVTRRRATVPPMLADLVMCCMEKRAADRPQTAAEIVHQLDALSTPSGGMTPTTALPVAKRKPGIPKAVMIGAAVVFAVAVAALAVTKFSRGSAAVAPAEVPSIAVLPFENRGRAEGQEFTDGMTEEITNRLSAVHSLRVIGRQSARSYASTTKSPQQIAQELGVQYLLTGTVRWDRSADGKDIVRVSPALLRASDATQVWADAYQTVVSGIFEVQARVATEVANALNIALLVPEKNALAAQPTDNLEAYSYYLRGNELIFGGARIPDIKEGIKALEKAVQIDPGFALAYARLSLGHTELFWFSGDRTAERLRLAKAAADKALSLNPDFAEGHIALGVYYYHGFLNYEKALAEFAQAERLKPGDFLPVFYAAAIKRRQGDFRGSLEGMEKAIKLEPRVATLQVDLALTYFMVGDYARALRVAEGSLVLDPQSFDGAYDVASIQIARDGKVDAAVAAYQRTYDQSANKQFAAGQALLNYWPAALDPEIRQAIEGLRWSPDLGEKGNFYLSRALLYHWEQNSVKSRAYADSAVKELIARTRALPDEGNFFASLAIAYAVTGNRTAAIAASDKALALKPVTKDAYSGTDMLRDRAIAFTIIGDHEGAITALEKALATPSTTKPNWVRLNPIFAPLRNNPRFRKLVDNR